MDIADLAKIITEHVIEEKEHWEKVEIALTGDPSKGVVGLTVRIDRLEGQERRRQWRLKAWWVAFWGIITATISALILRLFGNPQ